MTIQIKIKTIGRIFEMEANANEQYKVYVCAINTKTRQFNPVLFYFLETGFELTGKTWTPDSFKRSWSYTEKSISSEILNKFMNINNTFVEIDYTTYNMWHTIKQ